MTNQLVPLTFYSQVSVTRKTSLFTTIKAIFKEFVMNCAIKFEMNSVKGSMLSCM